MFCERIQYAIDLRLNQIDSSDFFLFMPSRSAEQNSKDRNRFAASFLLMYFSVLSQFQSTGKITVNSGT